MLTYSKLATATLVSPDSIRYGFQYLSENFEYLKYANMVNKSEPWSGQVNNFISEKLKVIEILLNNNLLDDWR